MHTLDIIVGIITVILVILGIRRGLIGELVRLAAMICGFIIAFLYYREFAYYLRIIPVPTQLRNGLSFLLIYITAALVIVALGWIVHKAVHLSMLGWIDRIIGGLLGVAKSILLAWIICLSVSSFSSGNNKESLKSSIVFSNFERLPPVFSLDSIDNMRIKFRKLRQSNSSIEKINRVQQQFGHFREVVDSAKKAQDSK